MSEPPHLSPVNRQRSDRWSGRKTLLFIIIASLLLWAVIALILYLV